MRLILNGRITEDTLKIFKSADDSLITGRILNADGTVYDMTSATATLEVYDTVNRKNAASVSWALVTVVAANGSFSFTPAVATTNLVPGTYYVYLKSTIAGVTLISDNYYKLTVG